MDFLDNVYKMKVLLKDSGFRVLLKDSGFRVLQIFNLKFDLWHN